MHIISYHTILYLVKSENWRASVFWLLDSALGIWGSRVERRGEMMGIFFFDKTVYYIAWRYLAVRLTSLPACERASE